MCCHGKELPEELTKERAASLEKVMATPYEALATLLDKLGPFLAELMKHSEVRDGVREFVENDLQGWLAVFELDSDIVSTIFERTWSRSG